MSLAFDTAALLDTSSVARRTIMSLPTCGPGSLFFGQVGEWTWQTVSALCGDPGFSVHTARTSDDLPTYLSFYYYRVLGSSSMHHTMLAVGDELDISSRSFNCGSESVLTLHRIARRGTEVLRDARPLDVTEFYRQRDPACLYVENFNRWISRTDQGSNENLISAAPVGFRYEHLPTLPAEHSPRGVCGAARRSASFHPHGVPGFELVGDDLVTTHRVDVIRDLNAVGLVYFASYFAIIDSSALRMWLLLGRTERTFLARRVLDYQMGFFGNANIGATLAITARLWRRTGDPAEEIVEATVRVVDSHRLIAVASIRIRGDGG